MVPQGGRIGVAVSGGADSIVLLHVLHRLGIDLTVLHVNHKLRGPESDRDEEFVRDLSAELGLPFFTRQAEPGAGNLEQEARRVRLGLFGKWMAELDLARIAVGHTRTDQAETVLFRMLRGSGPTGLSGMRPFTSYGIVRPLLTTSRDEVRHWARQESILWREDASNQDVRFRRNRLRLETIPELAAAYNPNLERVLAGTAELLSSEEDFWNLKVRRLYPKIAKRTSVGSFLQVDRITRLHMATRRRLIRHAIAELRGDLRSIERDHIEAVLNLCRSVEGHDRVIIPGVDALRSYGCLRLATPGSVRGERGGYEIPLTLGKTEKIVSTGGEISVNTVNSEVQNCVNFKDEDRSVEIAYLDGEAIAGQGISKPLRVRNWEPGDAIVPRGGHRAVKIKELFGVSRVLLWERRHWPVVAAGDKIVWVRRFGADTGFLPTERTRHLIRLIYRSGGENGS